MSVNERPSSPAASEPEMIRLKGPGAGLVADIARHHPALAAKATGLALATSVCEAFALALIAPIVLSLGARSADQASGMIALAALLMALRAGLGFARARASARLTAAYEADLGRRVASRLAQKGWPFVQQLGGARIQSLLERDAAAAVTAAHYALALFAAIALVSAQLAAAMTTDPQLTLVGLSLMALGALAVWPVMRRARQQGADILESGAEATGQAMRMTGELKTALAQGSEARFVRRYALSLERAAGERARFDIAQSKAASALIGVGALVAAAIAFVGIEYLAVPAPAIIAILIILARMAGPAQGLLSAMGSLLAESVGHARLVHVLGRLDGDPPAEPDAAPLDWASIEASGIAISHAGLESVDLRLARGEWLALHGASGAGKTSLIDVIVGLAEPDGGRLLVDGEPLDPVRRAAFKAGVGYVGQDEYLFAASLQDNLTAGSGPVSAARIDEVLDAVGLSGLVAQMEDGLDTRLGERGMRLSGGERQRLGIARALLRRPCLLILDEATNALDEESEGRIMAQLRRHHPDMAVLLVAHRPSSRELADRIITL